MKWKTNPYKPQEGDIRHKRKFAFLPKDCGEYTVWLETYDSVQRYQKNIRAEDNDLFWVMEWVEIRREYLVLYP